GTYGQASSIPGRNNPGVLKHQDYSSLGGPGAGQHAFGDDESLPWRELHDPVFHVDQQLALDDVEELVVMVMFVPVILTLNYSHPNDRGVHLAKRLVVPLMWSRIRERFLIDQLQGFVQNVQ